MHFDMHFRNIREGTRDPFLVFLITAGAKVQIVATR